jgi:hypothetical protein
VGVDIELEEEVRRVKGENDDEGEKSRIERNREEGEY